MKNLLENLKEMAQEQFVIEEYVHKDMKNMLNEIDKRVVEGLKEANEDKEIKKELKLQKEEKWSEWIIYTASVIFKLNVINKIIIKKKLNDDKEGVYLLGEYIENIGKELKEFYSKEGK